MKLEFQIVVLLIASIVALAFHYFVPRTELMDCRDGDWIVGAAHAGSGSSASAGSTERGTELAFAVSENGPNPFAGLTFSYLDGAGTINLDWVSQFRLKAYIEGKHSCYFRLYLKNRITEINDTNDITSRQCNEFAFKLSDEPQTVVIDRERFHVPTWWAERYATNFSHSIPAFDQVSAIEIFTGDNVRTDSLRLVVEEIEVSGHWVPPIVLYRALLASWLILGFGVVLQRTLELRKRIRQGKERETRLRLINVSLESQASMLNKMAHRDALTGLLNRLGLRKNPRLLPESLEASNPVSLIIFDIDLFKMINDSHGHNFGDQVLSDIGSVLLEAAKPGELVARWGGEEFLMVCFEKTELMSCGYAESLRTLIETEVGVTCSFGVCEINEDETLLDALDRADRAMYHAKYSGRNQVVAFSHLPAEEQCESSDDENSTDVETANV